MSAKRPGCVSRVLLSASRPDNARRELTLTSAGLSEILLHRPDVSQCEQTGHWLSCTDVTLWAPAEINPLALVVPQRDHFSSTEIDYSSTLVFERFLN